MAPWNVKTEYARENCSTPGRPSDANAHCSDYFPLWFVYFKAALLFFVVSRWLYCHIINKPESLWLSDAITVASELVTACFLCICCSSRQPNKLDRDQMLMLTGPSDSVSHNSCYSNGKQENRSLVVKSLGSMRKQERFEKRQAQTRQVEGAWKSLTCWEFREKAASDPHGGAETQMKDKKRKRSLRLCGAATHQLL